MKILVNSFAEIAEELERRANAQPIDRLRTNSERRIATARKEALIEAAELVRNTDLLPGAQNG